MRKFIVFLCAMLCFAMGLSTVALGAPEPGTWNEVTTGIAATLDPGEDGPTTGDVTMGRDTSSSSYPGFGHYWYFNGLIRDTLYMGPMIVDGNTGTRTVHTTRSGGTFYIRGDHLWGHDPDTIYTATIQNESSGVVSYVNESETWRFDGYEGETHIWGYFDDYPHLIDFTAHASIIDNHFWSDDYDTWLIVAELTDVEMQIENISSFSQVVYSEHRLRYGLDYFGVGTWFGFKDKLDTGYYATISGGPLTGELTLNAPYEFMTGYNEFWYKWPEEDPSILPEFSNRDYFFRLYDSTDTQIVLTNGDVDGTVTLTSGTMQKLPFVELTVTTTGDFTKLTWYDISGYVPIVPIELYRVDLVNPDPAGPWALETKKSRDFNPGEIQSHSVEFYTKELFKRYPEITFRVDARQLEYPGGDRTLVNRSSLYYTESAPNFYEDFDKDGIPNGCDPDILSDFVNNLPPEAFKKKSGVIQGGFGSICENIEQKIIDGDCDNAIRKLENLRMRFDGCDGEFGMPDKNDWIIDCEAQLELRRLTDLLIENLTTNCCSF